jgi:hypothetical protein
MDCFNCGACWILAVVEKGRLTTDTTNVPETRIRWTATCRMVPSRYPSVGILDQIASPGDLEAIMELEAWTNDRLSVELGILTMIPPDEWVVGESMASVVMAAFCHPRPGGARFSGPDRGAWYAARTVDTALAESLYQRTREIAEVGHFDTRMEMRLYHADFAASFHDVRGGARAWSGLYDPASYVESQRVGRALFDAGSNGIVYDSVRDPGGTCLACFRPRLVQRVRVAAHYEYRWTGSPTAAVRRLAGRAR